MFLSVTQSYLKDLVCNFSVSGSINLLFYLDSCPSFVDNNVLFQVLPEAVMSTYPSSSDVGV